MYAALVTEFSAVLIDSLISLHRTSLKTIFKAPFHCTYKLRDAVKILKWSIFIFFAFANVVLSFRPEKTI